MTSSVLVVTNEQDLGADLLVLELQRRGVDVLRCNTERSAQWQLTLQPGETWTLEDPLGRRLTSQDTASVWWRRPEPPAYLGGEAAPSKREAFIAQWQAMLEALASVPGPRWCSPPHAIRAAEDKARQLQMAAQTGLRVPRTVWANHSPNEPALVVDGQLVAKPVTAATWNDDQGSAFVFAGLVDEHDLRGAAGLAWAPTAFQRPITPKRDVRVTVIGARALAAVAGSPEGGGDDEVDWRLHPQRQWSAFDLAPALADLCVDLVRTLGLRFGGIDLAIDNTDQAWFLEVNPNGEWGWLTAEADLPIVSALADDLTLRDLR